MGPPYLSDLLLFKLVPLDHRASLDGPTAPVVDHPLLAQQVGLLLRLGALHRLFVPGQMLQLLLFGYPRVLSHLLRKQQTQSIF